MTAPMTDPATYWPWLRRSAQGQGFEPTAKYLGL